MIKKTKFNRFLSLILAITMAIGVCPMSVFANESTSDINLSMKDVNENQNVFSKSYMFDGELKTLYAYNTDNGTCRITGDIPYAGGTFGHISVRNEKGYLEFPFTLSDLEVVCFTDENSAEGCSVLFLTKDKELRNFTFVEEAWNKIEESGSYIPKPSTVTEYEAPVIYSNIKKIEKNFFIDYNGVFRVYAGNLVYDIANNVDDFIFLGNNTIKVTYKSGDIEFASVDSLWGGFIDNLPSPFDNSEVIGGHYGFEKVNYLSFKNESDGSITIIPSEEYLKLDNLLATSGLESLNLSKENASSVNENTYVYSLFNGNVTLGVVLLDKDVVYSLNISTSDNSTPILLGSGVDTKFGKIEFKYNVFGDSYGSISLYNDNDYDYKFKDSLQTMFTQAKINYKSKTVYVEHDFFMRNNVGWDWYNGVNYKINGSIFQSGYDLGDYIIDLYINYSTEEARLTNRNTGVVYDISSSVDFEPGYITSIGDIVENTFDISRYRDTVIFPSLSYKSDLDCIIMSTDSEYNYNANLKAILEQTYVLKNNQLENLTADKDYSKYIWHLYNLHCIMRTNANCEALKYGYISQDVRYILNSYFDIDISMQELSTNTNYKYSELSSDAVYTALYIEYLLSEGDNEYALELKEKLKSSYKDGVYTQDFYLIEDLKYFNIDYIFDIYVEYLLDSDSNFKLSNLVHTYTDEVYNYDTDNYEYIDYEVKQLPYEGYNLSSTSLILQEQSPLYTTVCPYEYSSFIITDTSVVDKSYYALGTNGVLYNIAFDSDYMSEGLSNSWEFSDTSANASIMSQTKIADNVVKVNTSGQYLTSDGKLYTKDGVLLKQGVTNISDNLYELNGTWYYITSNTEFKFNYASDKNVRPTIVKSTDDYITYKFMFNEDVAYMVNPDGDIIKNGGTYTIDTNGYYVFEVVNSYGDKFTEVIVVNHLGMAGIVGISPMVVDRILTLYYESGATVEYSFDDSTWLEYTDKIDMSDKSTIYFKGYNGDISLGKYKLTLDSNSKVNLYNISPAEFNPDNFCGLGYIKDGALFNSLNKIEVDGVTEASMLDADNFVYLDDAGNLIVTQKYGDSSGYGKAGFMPVFRSNKIEFESDVTNPIDIYTDGLYTYLLGDSGNLVSVNLGDMIFTEEFDTYSYNLYTDWYETWLSSDVVRIHNGVAYKSDGSTISLNYYGLTEQELLDEIKSLEFYDKNSNLVSNPIITTFRALGGKVYVLTSTLDVYSGYVESGRLDYDYTIDLEAQNIDFTVEETDWLNTNSYGIEFNLPNDFEVYSIPDYQTSTPYTLSTLQQNTFGMTDSGLFKSYVAYRDGGYSSGEPYYYYIETKDAPLELSFVLFDSQYYVNSGITVQNKTNNTYINDFTVDIVTENYQVFKNKTYDNYLGGYITGCFKYTYILEPNTIYSLDFVSKTFLTDSEGNMFRVNGAYSSLKDYMYVPSYISIESNFGDRYSSEELSNGDFKFTPSTNGIYNIVLKNASGKSISKGRVRVGNLDIYKPKLTTISYDNGVINPIFDDIDDTTGRTSKSGVWTLEYSTDNGVSWNTFEGGLTYSPSTTFNLRRSTVVAEPQVKVRATDKAGNVSDIYTVNLDMSVYESYVYENGKTTVKFYADNDSSWTDSSLSYSYDIGANFVNGHEFSVLVDTDAILKADKNDVIPSSAQKPISIEVVTADKTNTVLTGDIVTVETGNYVNADFSKLYVNIDKTGYQEYTLEEMSKQLGVGSHIVESYYEVEKDGQIIKSQEDLVVVTVPAPSTLNDTEIHTNVTYENGKTILDFYANDDTSNTEFTYSYIVNGNETSGHRIEATTDTLVELVAKKTGYEDGTKLTNIVVISTDTPTISDLVNNKNVTVSKGDIVNATLDKITVTIDGAVSEVTTPSQIFELLDEGNHTIKATQTVKSIIDGKTIVITSDEVTSSVVVKGGIILHPTYSYENGKTIVTFYANDDVNHNLGYTYKYEIDGTVKTGHSFEVTSDANVIIKAEKSDKIPTETDLDVTVIKVSSPIITKVNDTTAKVTAGYIQNTNFDKLYIQYNNGKIVEFTSTVVDVPLVVGENIVKAYIGTKTTINGQTVTIVSDTTEKTFNIGDSFNVVVKDHFGSNINTRLEQVFVEGATYTFSALNVEGWNVVGTSTYSGTVLNDLVIDFYYEEVVEELPTYYTLTVKDTFGVDTNIRFTQQLEANSSYVVNALVVNGWECSNVSNYSGTITNDIVIEFNYVKSTNPQTYYTLTVKDTFGSETNVRFVQTLVENSSYVVNALNVDGWLINGVSNYSGTIAENLVIEFVYTKETQPIPTYYTLTVKDTFGSDTNVRFTYSFVEGSNYSVNSMVVDGWNVVGNSSYSGTMTEDTIIEFVYEKETTPVVEYCTLIVKDKFGETTNVRYTQELTKGSTYSVSALDVGGWHIVGDSKFQGQLTKDIVIEFIYEKDVVEAPKYFTLTVKDHFGSDVSTRTISSLLEGSTYNISSLTVEDWKVAGHSKYEGSITSDLTLDFYYEKVKDDKPVDEAIYYNIIVKDKFGDNVKVRVEETLKVGDSYSFESLNVNGWKVVGNSKYEGVISSDIVIEFVYKQEIVPPQEDESIIEPPKTGDTTNLIIPIVFMFVGLFGVIISLMSKKQTKCD